jgi:hypothetical protein
MIILIWCIALVVVLAALCSAVDVLIHIVA